MRIRQIKPEFWTDKVTARLSDGARLLYIGLWNIADDDGYLEWDPDQIGAALFSYETAYHRVRRINKGAQELVEAGRMEVLGCGHAYIPTLTVHQRLSGSTKRVLTYARKHYARQCPHIPAEARGNPHIPGTEQGTGNGREQGTERNGTVEKRAHEKLQYRDGEWVYLGEAVTA